MAEKSKKSLYEYTNEDAPDNLVVNVSISSVIVQAEAHEQAGKDKQRIDQGDRRLGDYYLAPEFKEKGIQKVKELTLERLASLEKIRQIRTGERPADWVFEARERAAKQHAPDDVESIQRARANLEIAASLKGRPC